jgi:preprotein translocase subunit SecD
MLEKMMGDRRIQILIVFVVLSIALVSFRGISTGLDLQGGSLIQIQTERPLSQEEMDRVITIMDERLRGGLKVRDVKLKPWGNEFILAYIAGVDPIEAGKLIGKPGKLTVTIGNVTAFTGDELTRIDPFGYEAQRGNWGVPFTISDEAAERFRDAAIETNFDIVYMYLDDIEVNTAPISLSLQKELAAGKIVSSMVLETGGKDEGMEEARRIEVILRSGALPIKVDMVGSYGISAALGEGFGNAAITAGFLAFIGVAVVIYTRYRRLELVLSVLVTGASEIIIIFGVASLIRWDIDLPAIAGIIAAVGTGMDNQIVILDEILMEKEKSMRYRIKNAFFIVMGSWMTLIAAMVPLFIIGFGMLKGFAVTTMIGATAGVFITRPAYARMLQFILKK